VWEIKSPKPRPVLRVFGRFAEKDVLIATNLGDRATLGGWGSREWRDAIETCKAEWRRLFPSWEPLCKGSIHDYVSNAIDGKYYK
jgi:hypothetical protein